MLPGSCLPRLPSAVVCLSPSTLFAVSPQDSRMIEIVHFHIPLPYLPRGAPAAAPRARGPGPLSCPCAVCYVCGLASPKITRGPLWAICVSALLCSIL